MFNNRNVLPPPYENYCNKIIICITHRYILFIRDTLDSKVRKRKRKEEKKEMIIDLSDGTLLVTKSTILGLHRRLILALADS